VMKKLLFNQTKPKYKPVELQGGEEPDQLRQQLPLNCVDPLVELTTVY
jgi:hypothetical protein